MAKQPAAQAAPKKLSPEIDPAWYDALKPGTPGPGKPVPPDRTRPTIPVVEKERPLVKRLEVGGFVSGGLDATDGATRFGGFYGKAAWLVAPRIAILGRYQFGSGHVVERFPGSAFGQFNVPNQTEVLESRHAFEAGASYVARLTKGEVRLFAMPYLGPRVALFVNDYAPRWAFEADIALRVGAWAGDDFEASAFFAYDPAIAKAQGVADVQGTVLTEMRFGASASTRLSGPLGASFGYEGTTINLEHGKVSTHALVLGVNYWFR